MKFRETPAYRNVNARIESFFANRNNAKRGGLPSHFQLFLKESLPKKILSLGVVGAATLTFAGVLKDGLDGGTESGRNGLSALPEAPDSIQNCVMNGILGCIEDTSTTSAPTGTETTGQIPQTSEVYCTGEPEKVTVKGESGKDILGEIAVRNEGSSATPEQIMAGPFWKINTLFDPATLQDGQFYLIQGDCVDPTFGG